MKEMLTKQFGIFFADQTEGVNYVLGCMDADICPICGGDLLSCETIIGKGDREQNSFECLNCDWHDYV